MGLFFYECFYDTSEEWLLPFDPNRHPFESCFLSSSLLIHQRTSFKGECKVTSRFKANANSIQRPILILPGRVRTVTPSLKAIIYVFVLSFALIHMQIRNGVYERAAGRPKSIVYESRLAAKPTKRKTIEKQKKKS